MIPKTFILAIAAASFLSAGGAALAEDTVSAPIRLTDAQMDHVVAGGTFVVDSQTYVFQGYSTKPQRSSDGQGTSGIVVSTELNCPGSNISSCYAPGKSGGLSPNTTATAQVGTFGPGKSPSLRIFMNQGRL